MMAIVEAESGVEVSELTLLTPQVCALMRKTQTVQTQP